MGKMVDFRLCVFHMRVTETKKRKDGREEKRGMGRQGREGAPAGGRVLAGLLPTAPWSVSPLEWWDGSLVGTSLALVSAPSKPQSEPARAHLPGEKCSGNRETGREGVGARKGEGALPATGVTVGAPCHRAGGTAPKAEVAPCLNPSLALLCPLSCTPASPGAPQPDSPSPSQTEAPLCRHLLPSHTHLAGSCHEPHMGGRVCGHPPPRGTAEGLGFVEGEATESLLGQDSH